MRTVILIISCLLNLTAFASPKFASTDNGNLKPAEVKTLKTAIFKLAINKYEASYMSVSIDYSCTKTPMMRVFCAISLNSEGGTLGAATAIYDRNKKTAYINEHEI